MQLECNGLGLRKEAGYGRIAVNRQGRSLIDNTTGALTNSEEEILADSNTDNPGAVPPDEVQNLLCSVIRSHCLSEVRQIAMTAAGEITKQPVKLPSNSLLGRLRLFLKHDSFVENLDNLRDTAKGRLKEGRIDTTSFGLQDLPDKVFLFELLKEVWTQQEAWTRKLVENYVSGFQDVCNEETRNKMINTLVDKNSSTMCRVFLECLLISLHRE